jgi:hypothetical protein
MAAFSVALVLALFATADASRGDKKFRKVSLGAHGYPGSPTWSDYKKSTFLVSGSGDALYDGCYVFAKFDSSDAFSMAYVNTENRHVYLHFAEWMGCGALVPKNCRHNGWWLSQMMCATDTTDSTMTPGSQETLSCKEKGKVDGYFAAAFPEGGKIPAPSTLGFGCPPSMDGSTLGTGTGHGGSRAVRSDSNSTMYSHNCDEPFPTVSMNACSGEKPKAPPKPAPKSGAAHLTLLVPFAMLLAKYF